MANRIAPLNTFATLAPPWQLSSLDQNSSLTQGALNDSSLGYVNTGADTGTVNNYIVTPPYGVPSAYNPGFTVVLVPTNTNTAASTITVNPLGAVAIQRADGTAVLAGDIVTGQAIALVYYGSAFRIVALGSGALGGLFVKRAGDTLAQGANFLFQSANGLASSSYSTAPICVQTNATAARPQVAFWDVFNSIADSLYLETDFTLRHIGSDGTTRILWDNRHNNTLASGVTTTIASGANLYINGIFAINSGGAGYIQNGCTLSLQSGAGLTVNSGANIIVQSGGVLYIQGANGLVLQSGGQVTAQNGSNITLQAGSQLVVNTAGNALSVNNEVGLGTTSWSSATLRVYCNGAAARPGIGFWSNGQSAACMLYYEGSSNKFCFVDTGGTVHQITST